LNPNAHARQPLRPHQTVPLLHRRLHLRPLRRLSRLSPRPAWPMRHRCLPPASHAQWHRPDNAPWPPPAAPAPSPGDSLARLRGALAQCAAMSNELSRASCLTRTRQNFCGDAWGRIPECPPGQ